MKSFEIVAHRGVPFEEPENTINSFLRAMQLGADAVEFDVRLTADRIPVVYHYYYLDKYTTGRGPIFAYTLEQLRPLRVYCLENPKATEGSISTLDEVIGQIGGRIGMEIEIKGPEPEAPQLIGEVLAKYKRYWPSIEVTSFEPALLLEMQKMCPDIAVDLLYPLSESWMKLDVAAYRAVHHTRLAKARAVHLHSTQLSPEVIRVLRSQGIEIHAWDVNDMESLKNSAHYGISRICTDRLQQALDFRARFK
ncbi:MAG: glycerophosphodiester phosphodiesterase [Anaerolineales bacterium]